MPHEQTTFADRGRAAQQEVELALAGLSPPEQAAVLTETLAGVLTHAGVTTRSDAFTAFLATFATVLPGRMNAIRSEIRDASH